MRDAIELTGSNERLIAGASVHPCDLDELDQLEAFVEAGAKVSIVPDDPGQSKIRHAILRADAECLLGPGIGRRLENRESRLGSPHRRIL
jgi:hypothetical protein